MEKAPLRRGLIFLEKFLMTKNFGPLIFPLYESGRELEAKLILFIVETVDDVGWITLRNLSCEMHHILGYRSFL